MSVEVATALLLLALGLVGAAQLLAGRIGVPAPILLAVAGLVYAELPGPNVPLNPNLVMVLVIPPLIYSTALQASIIDIRSHRRDIGLLSIGLVIATALGVGLALHAIVPGLPFAAAAALGAAVAPNDPISALAIARSVRLPARVVTVVEGESLLNDATALTALTVAVAAVGGNFSVGDAAGRFALAVAGGIAVGLAVAYAVRILSRRIADPTLQSLISLVTPLAAFLPAQELHSSGVLAVAICGLRIAHQSPEVLSGSARLQGQSVWSVVALGLEGIVFLLIGVQLPAVLDGIGSLPVARVVVAAVVTVVIVVLGRPIWLLLTMGLPARLGLGSADGRLGSKELTALSWAGMRGVVTMAAAFSLPVTVGGRPFPDRDLLVFVAFVVVLVTLVGQGLTYAPLLRRLDLHEDRAARAVQVGKARKVVIQAGVHRLDELADADNAEVVDRLKQRSLERLEVLYDRLTAAGFVRSGREPTHAAEHARTAHQLRAQMFAAERSAMIDARSSGQLDEAGMRQLERELDLEEGSVASSMRPPPS